MNSGEAFCDKHGPYDASLGGCPYCAREQGLPPAPVPLGEMAPWGGDYPAEEEETAFNPRSRRRDDDLDVTQWPERRRAGADQSDETVVERAADKGLLGFLIVKDGMRRGQVHRIHNGATIGRDNADILIRDPKISRPHAKFTVEAEQFLIWDFGSENGTYVNDQQIRGATPLKENDVIRIGDASFVLKTLVA